MENHFIESTRGGIRSMRKPDGQTLLLGSVIVGAIGLLGYLLASDHKATSGSRSQPSARLTLAKIPFDGQRAYRWLSDLCALGRRPSGSPGMRKQQQLLADHFTRLGGEVDFQRFRHWVDGEAVPMANLVVQWQPDRKQRILLCAHYDTRPYPDRDPNRRRRRGTFVGANDGASGVAVLCEMARHMRELDSRYGVDFVLFDGEEYILKEKRDTYFAGSEHFARQYVADPPPYRYRYGVLLDMVGDANLQIYQEKNSLRRRDSRRLVQDIWTVAADLEVREFIRRGRYTISDDHVPLMDIADIPACDIIDFDYTKPGTRRSYWHTEADTPDKCSALSLAKVGWVVHEWLRRLE